MDRLPTVAPVLQNMDILNVIVTGQDSKSLAKGRRISTARLLLAIVCVFLVLLGSTLEAAHSHPGFASHADCALCATAHVVAQVPTSLSLPAVALLVEAVPRMASLPTPRAFSVFALFTRPPPFVVSLA